MSFDVSFKIWKHFDRDPLPQRHRLRDGVRSTGAGKLRATLWNPLRSFKRKLLAKNLA
jgi:hypothetical protein